MSKYRRVLKDSVPFDGYYYLHTNGSLIFKKSLPEEESSFVRAIWPVNTTSRGNAWVICVEALALGADRARIDELAAKWNLTDDDAPIFAQKLGLKLVKTKVGWIVELEEQQGWGKTALEAFADFAKAGLSELML